MIISKTCVQRCSNHKAIRHAVSQQMKETILQKPSFTDSPGVCLPLFCTDFLFGNLCGSHQVAIAGHRFDVPEAQESTQWGGNWFPFLGGRYHIITQLAIYTWYISGIYIYCQLGDYMVPTTKKKGNQKQLLIYFNTASFQNSTTPTFSPLNNDGCFKTTLSFCDSTFSNFQGAKLGLNLVLFNIPLPYKTINKDGMTFYRHKQ